jgi:hypothetical protein
MCLASCSWLYSCDFLVLVLLVGWLTSSTIYIYFPFDSFLCSLYHIYIFPHSTIYLLALFLCSSVLGNIACVAQFFEQ